MQETTKNKGADALTYVGKNTNFARREKRTRESAESNTDDACVVVRDKLKRASKVSYNFRCAFLRGQGVI
ncbi:MAG: hypothetical protein D6687_05155 [Acidobacteria bacterium]|nr:MAG: hypothetical protein D6687_05155 [Acidobacteriota bacterium]